MTTFDSNLITWFQVFAPLFLALFIGAIVIRDARRDRLEAEKYRRSVERYQVPMMKKPVTPDEIFNGCIRRLNMMTLDEMAELSPTELYNRVMRGE